MFIKPVRITPGESVAHRHPLLGAFRPPAQAALCFSCKHALGIGPSRRLGFCRDCWTGRRGLLPFEELGGEG